MKMKYFLSFIVLGTIALIAACDSPSPHTRGFLRLIGLTDEGSEDWTSEGCAVEDAMTICQNPVEYEIKFIRVTPYACGEGFVSLCEENGTKKEVPGFANEAPAAMNIIPLGVGFPEGVQIAGSIYTAGGFILSYNYVEAETSSGHRVRACYNSHCGDIEGAQAGDLLYRAPNSDEYKWMRIAGEMKSTRPDDPFTLQFVLGTDSIDTTQFFTPNKVLTFEKADSTELELTGNISNGILCNDSDENGECSFEFPEYYWPVLPTDWSARVFPR